MARPSMFVLAVQRLECGVGRFLGFHGDKRKATRKTAELVHDHVHFDHVAVRAGRRGLEVDSPLF